MLRIVHDGGSFRVLREEGEARVRIDGVVGPEADEDGLIETIEVIHRDTLGQDRLELDLRGVPYMSAVGLRVLLHWIELLNSEMSAPRYQIIALANPEHDWQRTSLRNLSRIAGDVLEIRTDSTE